ncbi:redoxin family protein [Flavobacterium subsaxonicum]|uniref:Thioredoxin domain-containing protein n=1 Tax=Flavobacterium subsaxonicum WB 4.1-42 = DSM 21790 TaxID=1121898 RepID=A0A0A2N1A2_9FLAO|nr:redoxin family protein [Flavobacterium subsaxonicum]KGO94225.1 hypothetical protein Q766_04675 [Flavobacterium subsaxonicum WB 4.1-42 = DSM 21790]
MKSKLLFLFLCITAFASAKTTVIKGHINGKVPDNLRYSAPVNGVSGFDIYYTAKVDVKGNFEILTDTDEITFIDVFYNYQWAGNIMAEPGGQYNLTITERDGKVTHQITGTNAGLQKQYSELVPKYRINIMHDLGKEASKIESPAEFKAFFDDKLLADLNALRAAAPKATKTDYLLPLIHEREYFYATAMSIAINVKHGNVLYENAPPVADAFNTLWKNLYVKAAPDKTWVQKLPFGYWFLLNYEFFKTYEAVGFNSKKNMPNNNLTTQEKRTERLQYMPAQNAEYYLAVIQHYNVFEGQLQEYALDSYLDFKKFYPNSTYIKYLEPEMAPLISFFAKSSALPTGAAYVNNYAQVNTMDELLKQFAGKKLYIDVWATWCGPCRDEFKYKDTLYKLLAANNITVIYISVDDENRDEGWKKMIGHYGLQGHHIRTNKVFYDQLKKMYDGTGGIAIPWYMLVNTNGTIAALHAAPPSDMSKLEEQIKKLKD